MKILQYECLIKLKPVNQLVLIRDKKCQARQTLHNSDGLLGHSQDLTIKLCVGGGGANIFICVNLYIVLLGGPIGHAPQDYFEIR